MDKEREAALADALAARHPANTRRPGAADPARLLEGCAEEAAELTADNFDLADELNKTYEKLDEKNDATAEARATRFSTASGSLSRRRTGP